MRFANFTLKSPRTSSKAGSNTQANKSSKRCNNNKQANHHPPPSSMVHDIYCRWHQEDSFDPRTGTAITLTSLPMLGDLDSTQPTLIATQSQRGAGETTTTERTHHPLRGSLGAILILKSQSLRWLGLDLHRPAAF